MSSYSNRKSQRVWPLSLLSLRASVKALSLPRKQIELLKGGAVPDKGRNKIRAGLETDCLTHDNLKQLFVRHVKPKKRHETIVMAQICANAAIESGVSCVVDVGGGKGHLSRLLSYGFRLHVSCVEAQSSLISSARWVYFE